MAWGNGPNRHHHQRRRCRRLGKARSDQAGDGDGGMNIQSRIESYVEKTGFPRSLFVSDDNRIVGTWIMGNDYRVQTGYYGGYPAGYLRRVKSLFPDKSR